MRDVLKAARSWPWALILLALPATVAVWSGWVGLGSMTGFGKVHPLPGIADGFTLDSAITLPVGVEVYGAYALGVWLSHRRYSDGTRRFACVSSIGGLVLGGAGQVAYHLLEVAYSAKVAHVAKESHRTVEQVAKDMPPSAPWWITTIVACFPVLVLGAGATLAHLTRRDLREVRSDVTPNITTQVPEYEPETVEVHEAAAEEHPFPEPSEEPPFPTSGPLETWYEHAGTGRSGYAVPDAPGTSERAPEYVPEEWTSVPDDGYSAPEPVPGDAEAPQRNSPELEPSPQTTPVPEGVPDDVPDPDPHQVQAASEFAEDLAAGDVPSIRRIRRALKVGQERATQVQAYLAVLAEQQPVPAQGGNG